VSEELVKTEAQEAADAVTYGYPLGANVRDELASWLRLRGETDPHAQRVAHLLSLQGTQGLGVAA
jgi:hypothetical protein